MAWQMPPTFGEIVTNPKEVLQFQGEADHPATIELAIHNPNKADSLAYYVKLTHNQEFIVTPSKGLLNKVDNRSIRITRKPNAKQCPDDTIKIVCTPVAPDTPKVDMAFFDRGSNKIIVFRVEHLAPAPK